MSKYKEKAGVKMIKDIIKSPVDGLSLGFIATEANIARGNVCIVHGMAEHKERYLPIMEFLSAHGYNCITADIRGHGESIKREKDLGHFYKGGGRSVVKDVLAVCEYAKKIWPDKPLFLLGHSMGSLAARVFAKEHDDVVDGIILSGSPSKNSAVGVARLLCALNRMVFGSKHRSKLMDKLAFGSYNKKFTDENSNFSWLSANKQNVKSYEKDPLCGFLLTNNGFGGLLYLLKNTYSGKYKMKNKGMPISFLAGEDDPCIGSKKQFAKAVKYMKKQGYNVSSKLYPDMRHEILNETGNQEVFDDVLSTVDLWVDSYSNFKNKKYVIALDQGTTSSRAIVFDSNRRIVSVAQKEFTQYYPKPGYVEHDPEEIYATQMQVLSEALRKGGISAKEVAAIGITNQRETTIMWDKNTGKPVYNAIVWQCRRTAEICDQLKSRGLEPMIQQKTGLVIDAYFSATKIKWLLENVKGLKKRAEDGEILFGTVDSWLIWKMTGGAAHVTDYTNASRTMLFNINSLVWDRDILHLLGIPENILPRVVPSSMVYGYYELDGIKIPIAGAAGDQQAALFGQCCFEKGEAKNTYGTGCFLLMNTGSKPRLAENGLLTTIGIGLNGHIRYAAEGSIFVGGAVVQWLRDEMGLLESAAQSEEIAQSLEDNGGVYFVPAFTGLGAPYWDMYARGAIYGLTRGTKREHIIRAALESMAFQTDDLLDVFESATGIELKELKVDGGACANQFLMQFQSDVSGVSVVRPASLETTALGAAMLAGLGVGMWKSLEELKAQPQDSTRFTPNMPMEKRINLKKEWIEAVKRTLTTK